LRAPFSCLVLSLLCAVPVAARAASISVGVDEEAGLPYWQVQDRGAVVRFVQRLPDQTRGFFQARGFSQADSDLVARSCVFQTVFRNSSNESTPGALSYDLGEWVVRAAGQAGRMKTREDWAREWEARSVPAAARIAFEWALFPTRQTYNPGDYNWGMSVFGLAPGTRFDLDLSWTQYGKRHAASVQGIECAPDDRRAAPENAQ